MTDIKAAAPVPECVPSPVVRLHPIRSLTISHDLAFRRRALVVLDELGPAAFSVTAFDRPEDAVALVVQQRADVLVLDVSVSALPLLKIVDALEEHAPRVGVVAVSDEPGHTARGFPLFAKWGWAADLRTAVEQAYHRGTRTGL